MTDEATQVEQENTATDTTASEPLDTRDVVAREIEKLEASQAKPETEADTSSDKARDESGRFKAKEPEPAPEAQAAPEAPTEPAPVEPARNPFSAWKKEAQTALSALPPETQRYIIEREQQFHKGIQQYKEDAQRGRTLSNAFAPHMEYLEQLQVAPETAIGKLLETERALRTGTPEAKSQMLVRLAHDYGIDVAGLTKVQFDPYSYQLEQRLAQQQAMLDQLSQSRQMAEQAQITQTIEQFAQTREHFSTVRETMADLLDKGFAADLDDAYEKAIRLEGLNVAPQQAAPVDLARQNNAAKAAKAAAVSVKGSPTGVTRAPEPKTTEEAVRMAMAKLGL